MGTEKGADTVRATWILDRPKALRGPLIKGALGVLVVSAACSQAKAGEYTVVYTNGRFKVDPIDYSTRPDPTPKPTYYLGYDNLDGGRYGGSATASLVIWVGGMRVVLYYGGTVQAQEKITATFTWHGEEGEDPPPAVIVREECTASFRETNGSRSTTLRVVSSTTNQETGEKYSLVENPGDSFQVHCTPTASNTTTVNSPGPSVSVSYKAQAYPADLVLGGGSGPNDAKQYLIGQRLTANLSCPLTPVSYQWSVNGGEPYAEFAITPTTGHRVAVAPATLTSAQYSACFAKDEPSVEVSLVARFGSAASGDYLTLTKELTTVRPTFTVNQIASATQSSLSCNALGWVFTGAFEPGQPGAGPQGFGVKATLEVPTEFKSEGVSGDWNWAQTLTTNYTRVKGGKTEQYFFYITLPNDEKEYFAEGHDGGFPYNTVWPLYDRDLLSPFGGERAEDHWQEGPQLKAIFDSCGGTFESGEQGPTQYSVDHKFKDFPMFLPGGTGSQHVPLLRFDWEFAGVFTKANGEWSPVGTPTIKMGTVDWDNVVATSRFPDWDHIVFPTQTEWVSRP